MQLGMIGLGRMGGNMVERLLRGGHQVVVFDRDPERTQEVGAMDGASPAASLEDLVRALVPPRVVWMMIPAGDPVEQMLASVMELVQPGDIVIDGGNSNFNDSARRAADVTRRGMHYIDAGTSGGVWGLENGYCMMVGGDTAAV